MTADTLRNDPGNALYALRSRARETDVARLVSVETAGLAGALGIWIWLPSRWPLALPFLALSAFGLWGVTDRTLVAGGRSMPVAFRYVLRSLRWIIVAAGVIAAAASVYLIVGEAIGTVVS